MMATTDTEARAWVWIVRCLRCDVSQRFDTEDGAHTWKARWHTYHDATFTEEPTMPDGEARGEVNGLKPPAPHQ